MHENKPSSTMNGHEIQSSREQLTPNEYKELLKGYGIEGDSPEKRVESLKKMNADSVALLFTDVNRRLQGSEETLISEKTVKIGETSTVAPEYRYDLFQSLIKRIAEAPTDITPERIGDLLALGIVLLHPFADGNGRTSRVIRLAFGEDYDSDEYEESFKVLAESRDIARKRGGSIILGYVPRFENGEDQSDPVAVEEYFNKLLNNDDERLYTGPYGYSSLKNPNLVSS